MRIFICTLFSMLLIFLTSVQSMKSGGISSPSREEIPHYVDLILCDRGNLYQLGVGTKKRPLGYEEEECVWTAWEQAPVAEGQRHLKSGDVLFRKRKLIAKLVGESFHAVQVCNFAHCLNRFLGREPVVQPQNGDLVLRSGVPIARYENGARVRIDVVDWEMAWHLWRGVNIGQNP